MRICPICSKEYTEVPALFRKDNRTEICPMCGMIEAIDSIPKTAEERVALAEHTDKHC